MFSAPAVFVATKMFRRIVIYRKGIARNNKHINKKKTKSL
jgi:hypothetical protein